MRSAQRALRFPDSGSERPGRPGCRKVRRGDDSRGSADGSPSPPSGSRQHTRRIAPQGGTVCAASSAKRAGALTSARERAEPVSRGRFDQALAPLAASARAVDTRVRSDIVEKSKKLYKSRGLPVSYQSATASPRVAPARPFESAEALRCAPRAASRPGAGNRLLTRLFAVPAERPDPREAGGMERSSGVAPRSGMGLAGFAGTGALPRGRGSRGGRRRHERVRFGVRATWLRTRRDAAHLLHGCVRTRRRRSGA